MRSLGSDVHIAAAHVIRGIIDCNVCIAGSSPEGTNPPYSCKCLQRLTEAFFSYVGPIVGTLRMHRSTAKPMARRSKSKRLYP